jgi:hypothetical protein
MRRALASFAQGGWIKARDAPSRKGGDMRNKIKVKKSNGTIFIWKTKK